MNGTKEFDEGAPRLPVAYSQGYVYVGFARESSPESGSVDRFAEQEQPKPPTEREVLPYTQIAIGAVAGFVGPFVGATIFLLLSSF